MLVKKWWFWLIVLIAGLVLLGAAGFGVYRLGFSHGSLVANNGEGLSMPFAHRFDLSPDRDRSFRREFSFMPGRPGGFGRMPGMRFFVSPLVMLVKAVLVVLVILALVLVIIRLARRKDRQPVVSPVGAQAQPVEKAPDTELKE
jgi:hypothetical protein